MSIGDGINLWLGRALAETIIGVLVVLAFVLAYFIWAIAFTIRSKLRKHKVPTQP